MHARIASVATSLLDRMKPGETVDLIERYALPIATTIIAEILGVPARDRHRFHRWSSAIVSINMSAWSMLRAVPPYIGSCGLFGHSLKRGGVTRRTICRAG